MTKLVVGLWFFGSLALLSYAAFELTGPAQWIAAGVAIYSLYRFGCMADEGR